MQILIAALEKNTRALGNHGGLVFKSKEDMKHFVDQTMGHTVIMGRKTWESIPPKYRPLPGRKNIVISRDAAYPATGAQVFTSLRDALLTFDVQNSGVKLFIAGGGEIYREALALRDEFPTELELTLFEDPSVIYDTTFPEFEHDFEQISEEAHKERVPPYSFTRWKMK